MGHELGVRTGYCQTRENLINFVAGFWAIRNVGQLHIVKGRCSPHEDQQTGQIEGQHQGCDKELSILEQRRLMPREEALGTTHDTKEEGMVDRVGVVGE